MPKAYVSIGSNVERDIHVPQALRDLAERFGALDVSSVYETAAVGFSGDPFYNLVVGFDTDQEVDQVAAALTELEHRHGRRRDAQKFAPRTLDLDLILYGDLVRTDRKPLLPRDEIVRYAFMLEPLVEIAPNLRDPLSGERYADLWERFDKADLAQRRVEPAWRRLS
ncbi:2-amino-4-hydroxy-6-hydroxymethyldihydropteridine diphosphokinase [Methylogaea oryzae]|uniref:2-amino-4-hydroxy-6-hydroxymethyldihydropteridine diphosphokinase n=1 Tax=Methylogaea oryzae TaxID=1295382 RepID=A0A8D5ALX6_9GAMM|nr:2-amino-4-hydroxy-6-hydroxymethyldihydropteridine diphosphokinase [Methylogaea oryzae]BBL72586.1 2-amino-4-hydroxy-6-hydroxymethyldihydropteridine diphosphokinase [Methylogaea oryzae]